MLSGDPKKRLRASAVCSGASSGKKWPASRERPRTSSLQARQSAIGPDSSTYHVSSAPSSTPEREQRTKNPTPARTIRLVMLAIDRRRGSILLADGMGVARIAKRLHIRVANLRKETQSTGEPHPPSASSTIASEPRPGCAPEAAPAARGATRASNLTRTAHRPAPRRSPSAGCRARRAGRRDQDGRAPSDRRRVRRDRVRPPRSAEIQVVPSPSPCLAPSIASSTVHGPARTPGSRCARSREDRRRRP